MIGVERDVRDLVDAVERLKGRGYDLKVVADNHDLHRMAKKLDKRPQVSQGENCKLRTGFWIGRCYFESDGEV